MLSSPRTSRTMNHDLSALPPVAARAPSQDTNPPTAEATTKITASTRRVSADQAPVPDRTRRRRARP